MLFKKTFFALMTAICLVTIGWLGCSDDTITTYHSGDTPSVTDNSGSVTYYFPLTQGFATSYQVTSSNGITEVVSYRVGKEVSVLDFEAVEWFCGHNADPGFFRPVGDALYYYDSPTATPEKILEMPLDPGNSWTRYSTIETALSDNDFYIDINVGFYDQLGGDDIDSDEGGLLKVYPSEGGVSMTVAQTESLQLSTGNFFSHAVKVYNEGTTADKTNYYWFVANVGLVKYVIGATDQSYPNGDLVAELINYGY